MKTTILRLPGLIMLVMALLLAVIACRQNEPVTDDPPALAGSELDLALARSGNLHYQNFLLSLEDHLIFSSIEEKLVSASRDGSRPTIIQDSPGSHLLYDGGQLFYHDGQLSGPLVKQDLDGTNRVRISHLILTYLLDHDERLYAIEKDSQRPVSLSKSGTDRRDISEEAATALILNDDQLYISYAQALQGVWCHDLDTGESRQLFARSVASLNVWNDWLYYTDPQQDNQVYAWSLQKEQSFQISSIRFDLPFIISEGYLYGILGEDQRRLYRWPVDGNKNLDSIEPQLVIDDAVAAFLLSRDAVYYQRLNCQRIYKVPLAGGLPVRIT